MLDRSWALESTRLSLYLKLERTMPSWQEGLGTLEDSRACCWWPRDCHNLWLRHTSGSRRNPVLHCFFHSVLRAQTQCHENVSSNIDASSRSVSPLELKDRPVVQGRRLRNEFRGQRLDLCGGQRLRAGLRAAGYVRRGVIIETLEVVITQTLESFLIA